MTVSVSIPKLLRKAAPVLKYGSIVLLIILVVLGGLPGFVSGLITVALCWIISFLCDAVVELYEQVEKLLNKQEST